jgi:hypothetical protein
MSGKPGSQPQTSSKPTEKFQGTKICTTHLNSTLNLYTCKHNMRQPFNGQYTCFYNGETAKKIFSFLFNRY